MDKGHVIEGEPLHICSRKESHSPSVSPALVSYLLGQETLLCVAGWSAS